MLLFKKLPMTRKLYIKTHGCQMNEYDSAKMADVLRGPRSGAHRRSRKADVLLLNTCSIREKAQEKGVLATGSMESLRKPAAPPQ